MKKVIFSLILLTFSFFVFSHAAYSKSYTYDYIKMNVTLLQNGDVVISQERAYDFVGSFSYAYLQLFKQGSSGISFLEIRDLDLNAPVQYILNEDSSQVTATWYYTANNQVKRFLISYLIKAPVKRYLDVAQLYWKVIEDSHVTISRFQAEVVLPRSSSNLFKIFIHSQAEPGQLTFSNDNSSVFVDMSSIPANSFVEFDVL